MQGCSCGTKGCTAREGTRRRLTGGIWRLRGLEGGETDFASQFPPRQLDAYSTPLELITGMSNPKGGNRTPVIRIYYRHIFDAYSASLELISGVSNPKGANRRPVIRIYYCNGIATKLQRNCNGIATELQRIPAEAFGGFEAWLVEQLISLRDSRRSNSVLRGFGARLIQIFIDLRRFA